jgi:outer membrane lipoprotein-sorting protein
MQRRSFLQSAAGFGLFALLAPALGRAALGATELKLTEADRALVRRVEDYLNGLTTLQARFLQSSSNGSYAEGDIYVERPSRMRFEYDPPVPLLIIADGYTLALYDKELKQVTQVPIWETPLWFLFKDTIEIADSLVLTNLTYGAGSVNMTIQEEQAEGNLSSVTLTFSEAPVELRKWEVVDAQGLVVQTGLLNPRYGGAMNPDLFDLKLLDVYNFEGGGSGGSNR